MARSKNASTLTPSRSIDSSSAVLLYAKVQLPETRLRVKKAVTQFFQSWSNSKNLVERFEVALRTERTKVMRMIGAKENLKAFVSMSKEYKKALQEFFDSNVITVISTVMDRVRREGLLLRPDISPLDLE